MKAFILSILLLIPKTDFAQTIEKEQEAFNKEMDKAKSDPYKTASLAEIWREWVNLVVSTSYSGLPYNKEKQRIEFISSGTFSGDIEKLTDQVKLHCAMHFGRPDEQILYITQDKRTIVLTGLIPMEFADEYEEYFDATRVKAVSTFEVQSTIVIDIEDNSFAIRTLNHFHRVRSHRFTGEHDILKPLTSMFPISTGEQNQWEAKIHLAQQTKSKIQDMIAELVGTINSN